MSCRVKPSSSNMRRSQLLLPFVHFPEPVEQLGQEAPALAGADEVDVGRREGIGLRGQRLGEGSPFRDRPQQQGDDGPNLR